MTGKITCAKADFGREIEKLRRRTPSRVMALETCLRSVVKDGAARHESIRSRGTSCGWGHPTSHQCATAVRSTARRKGFGKDRLIEREGEETVKRWPKGGFTGMACSRRLA